jgi:hypothetical protein
MESVKRISEKCTVQTTAANLYTQLERNKHKTICRKAKRKWGAFSTPTFSVCVGRTGLGLCNAKASLKVYGGR